MEREAISGSNIALFLNQSALFVHRTLTTEAGSYPQTFQTLREWEQGDTSDIYAMIIYVDRCPAHEHTRRNNAPNSSETVVIIIQVAEGEVGKRDIMLCERSDTNRNGSQVWDKVPIAHYLYDAMIYVLSFSNGRDR